MTPQEYTAFRELMIVTTGLIENVAHVATALTVAGYPLAGKQLMDMAQEAGLKLEPILDKAGIPA